MASEKLDTLSTAEDTETSSDLAEICKCADETEYLLHPRGGKAEKVCSAKLELDEYKEFLIEKDAEMASLRNALEVNKPRWNSVTL